MNNITINWSAEDRARIDKLITLLEDMPKHDCSKCVDAAAKYATNWATEAKTVEPVEQAEPAMAPEEVPAPIEDTPAAPVESTVSKADVQKKVVELSAAGKKAAVKEIVTAYAAKVSDIPEEHLDDVWQQLTALEG